MAASQKSSKKRAANSQAGPTAKKAHLDKSSKNHSSEKDEKRSRPVTLAAKDDSASDSEGDLELLEGAEKAWLDEDGDEPLEDGLEAEAPGDSMDVDAAPARDRDPNAARESHKAQKVVQEQRRAAKPHSTLLIDAKRVWCLANKKEVPAPDRQKHIRDLMDVIRGKVKEIVFKHDASRIVQTVVKYGGQKERDEVAAELKGKYRELAQNKYSKFLVTKLIRLCPSHRPSILLEFQGNILRLLLHREASSVLADAFELYANAYERTILLRDFYGKETALFSLTSGSTEDKERARKGLKGILEGVEGERRKRVLGALKENLVTIFNNPDKGAITHAVVHRALWEYLQAITDIEEEAEQEKLRREIFESCQDVLAEMVHTKDGSRAVREFIAQGSAKDRKHIVKVLKPFVERMCTTDQAQLVLFTALDVIDDTKLTTKSLVSPITASAATLTSTPQGRRAIFHLLVPHTRRHFTPAQIASLTETDAARAKTSKKDVALRREEIRKAASAELLDFVSSKGGDVVRETGGSLVVAEIMLEADGDKTASSEALLQCLAEPYPAPDPTRPHPIDLPHASRLYKTLLQGGHFNHTTRSVTPSTHYDAGAFARAFVKIVGQARTVEMAKGDGAFVVAELCERLKASESSSEVEEVKRWFATDVLKVLESGEGKGRTLLLEKIRAL